jgi:AraC-like DNA-binding protein
MIDGIDPEHRLLAPFNDRPLGSDNLYRPSDLGSFSALSCIKSMCVETEDPYARKLAILANLPSLLMAVCDSFNKRKTPELQSSIAGQITAYINEHLFEKLTVESIANHFFLSVSQVERIFKKATRASVWQYVNAKRLAAARVKIESGISAYTACEECAFGDYSSFYRAYVKAYGEGPGSFKKTK